MILEIVKHSFCKSPLELMVVAPFLFHILYFVVLQYGLFIVSSFAGNNLIFCGMPH